VPVLSEKALGKRRAIVISDSDDDDGLVTKKKRLTDHFALTPAQKKKPDEGDDHGKRFTMLFRLN
jgi:hypothetical protein